MKRIFVIASLCGLAACAHKPPVSAVPHVDPEVQYNFDNGMKALAAQRYEDAARIFDTLLVSNPGTELEMVTMFDSGAAHEGMGECRKAADRYRQVVRASAGKFRRIEAEALFRLSLTYECLGQNTKAITALLDARKFTRDLPPETLSAEIPARLAAAYARLNNRERAMYYFKQASTGLKGFLGTRKGSLSRDSVARTLFMMGKLSYTQKDATVDPSTYMQSISMQQPYLLQSMELGIKPWCDKAEEDLRVSYDNIWHFKFDDPQKERDFYTHALQTLHELRNIRLPKPDPVEDALFAYLDKTEYQLQTELAKNTPTDPLTPEAQKREGLRRQGRLVDPEAKKKKASSDQ